MITVACVLRSGGPYTPEWVYALKRNLNQYLADYTFRVLSDCSCFGQEGIPFKYNWPGWWSKLELFCPGLFEGPVLYLDLDTLVVGDLSEIATYTGRLAMNSDFFRPQFAQSGVMMWTPGPLTDAIWQDFCNEPDHMRIPRRDDGQWLHLYTLASKQLPDRLQDLFPGQLVSYKVEARNGPPPNARLVCFHGSPKQTDPRSGWAYERWMGLNVKESE